MNFKKFLAKGFLAGALVTLAAIVMSCGEDTGLGGQVDVEAPTIDILYPPASAAIRGTFVFSGIWNDDMNIKSITAKVLNTTTKEEYETDEVIFSSDKTWKVEINKYDAENTSYYNGWQLPDGKYEVSVYATDNAGHVSGTSARTFEIDNTAPVVVLTSPGTTDIEHATAYGSSFKVAGTIADEHTIGKLAVTVLDKNKHVLDSTDSIPYEETNVPTAGGTSVVLLKWSADADSTNENNVHYRSIYGDDETAGTIPYYCSLIISDNTHEYIDPAETTNTTAGNETTTFYLYDDVYEDLMSEKIGLGLSASDLMAISNGTYTGTTLSRAAATDENSVDYVKAYLAEKAVNTAATKLAFSLNPAVNPTFAVSGYALANEAQATAGQPVTIVVSMGLDEALIKPQTLKAYALDLGTGTSVPSADDYSAFLNMTADELEAAVNPRSATYNAAIECFADNEEYSSSSVETYAWTTTFSENIITNHWYIITVTGKDADGNDLLGASTYGFFGTVSGIAPKTRLEDYVATRNNSDDVTISGKSSSSGTRIDHIEYTVTVYDRDTGTYGDALTGTMDGTNPNWTYVAESEEREATWTLNLKELAGYEKQAENKNVDYTFNVVTYDDNENYSDDAAAIILVDTTKPKVDKSVLELGSGATITNRSAYYTKDEETGSFIYRLTGVWSDENGSGTDDLYYSVDGAATWKAATSLASTTRESNWSLELNVGQTTNGNIAFKATDIAGNESDIISYTGITFDYDSPTLSATTEPKSSVKKDGTITVAGTLTDTLLLQEASPYGITITAKKDGASQTLTNTQVTYERESDTKATYAVSIPAGNNDGEWVITISGKDKAGLASATLTYTVVVDSVPPQISIEDSTAKFFAATIPQTFTGSTTDNVGVTNVYYYISDSATPPTSVDTATWKAAAIDDKSWSATINFNKQTVNGNSLAEATQYYVYFAATDAVGNTTIASGNVPVTLDNTAPTSTLTSKKLLAADGEPVSESTTLTKDSAYLAKETFTLSGTITEVNFDSATIKVNGGAAQTLSVAEDKSWTYTPSSLTDGSYTYVITVTDKAEHTTSYTVTVTYDTKGPVVTVTQPTEHGIVNGSTDITGTASDASTIKAVYYTTGTWKDTLTDNNKAGEGTSWTKTLTFDDEGQVVLMVKAVDVLGNVGQEVTRTFYYDKDAPVFDSIMLGSSVLNEDGLTTNKDFTLTITVSDSNALYKETAGSTESYHTLTVTEGGTPIWETNEVTLTDNNKKGTASLAFTVGTSTDNPHLADGTHSLVFAVRDTAGRVTTITRVIRVDTTDPTLSDVHIDNTLVKVDESPYNKLTAKASDTGAGSTGLAGVFYNVKKAEEATPAVTDEWTSLAQAVDGYAVDINFSDSDIYPEGKYFVYVMAKDGAGNVSAIAKTSEITLDLHQPTITVASATGSDTIKDANLNYTVTIADTNPSAVTATITTPAGTTASIGDSTPTGSGSSYTSTVTVPFASTYTEDGTYTLSFTATDANERTSAAVTKTVLKDAQKPTVTITRPSAADSSRSNSYSFAGTVSDANLDTVTAVLLKGAEQVQSTTLYPNASGVWTWNVYELDDASYTVKVTAKDLVENTTEVTSSAVTVDATAPVTTLTGTGLFTEAGAALADGATLESGLTYFAKANTFKLAGTITETNFKSATVSVNGAAATSFAAAAGEWSYPTTAPTADGKYTYVFSLEDTAGNKNTYTVTVKLDSTAPTFTSNVTNNLKVYQTNSAYNASAQTFTVSGTWKDGTVNASGTNTLKYKFYNGTEPDTWTTVTGTTAAYASNGNWSFSVTATESSGNTLKLLATDLLGNEKTETYTGITFDLSAPVITLTTTPAASTNQAATVAGTIVDGLALTKDSDHIKIALKKDGAANTTITPTVTATTEGEAYEFTLTIPATSTNDGTWNITIDATDDAGQTAVQKSVTTVLDTTQPTVSALAVQTTDSNTLDSKTYFNSTRTLAFTLTATDTGGTGVDTVRYIIVKGHETAWSDDFTAADAKKTICNWTQIAAKGTTDEWAGTISDFVGDIDEGAYTIFALAEDKVGNKTYSSGLQVVADKTEPSLKETTAGTISSTGLSFVSTSPFVLTGTVADDNFATLTCTVDGSAVEPNLTNGNWTISHEISGGSKKIVITAKDKAGNKKELTRTVTLDTTAPTVTLAKLNNADFTPNSTTSSANCIVEGTAADEENGSGLNTVTAYYVKKGDETAAETDTAKRLGTVTVNPDNIGSWKQTFYNVAEGWYTLVITATDNSGNKTTKTRVFGVDSSAPTSTLNVTAAIREISTDLTETIPLTADTDYAGNWNDGKTYIAKENFTLSGTISDTFTFTGKNSKPGAVVFYVNNVATTTGFTKGDITGTDSNTMTWSYTPTALPEDGTYTYKLETTDDAGNKASYSFIVQVDHTAPQVSILRPVASQNLTSTTLAISGTAFDEGTGVQKVQYRLTQVNNDKSEIAIVDTWKDVTTLGAGKWSDSLTVSKEGKLKLYVRALDYLEQQTEDNANSVEFFYDSTPPVLSNAEVTTTKDTYDYYNTTVLDLTVDAADEVSGVGQVTYQIDNGAAKAMTSSNADANGNGTYTVSAILTEGEHTITIAARDTLSNSTATNDTSKTLTVKVDATAPVFADVAPSADVSNADITITGKISDGYGLLANGFTVTAKKDSASSKTKEAVVLPSGLTVPTITNATISGGETFSFTLPATADTNGNWEFTLTATDVAGNTTKQTVTAQIDTVPPHWTSDETNTFKLGGKTWNADNWYKDSTLSVTGYAEEAINGSGIRTVAYTIKRSGSADITGTIDPNKETGIAKFVGDISGFENGDELTFVITDRADNAETHYVGKIQIDSVAPKMSEYTDASNYRHAFTASEQTNGTEDKTLYYLVDDEDSKPDINTVTVTLDSTTYKNGEEGVTITETKRNDDGTGILVTITFPKELLADINAEGSRNVSSAISDVAGNSTSRSIGTLEFDNVPPKVTITDVSPKIVADGKTYVNKTVTITGTATDANTVGNVILTATPASDTARTWSVLENSDVISYDQDTKVWTARIDTTAIYNETVEKALDISVIAVDNAGNSTATTDAATRTLYIDQNTDRPVIKVSNLAKSADGTGYVLKYGTYAQISGTITDDDNTSDAIVQALYVGIDAFSANPADWTVTTSGDTVTATHTTYGKTELTLSSGDWTYTPAEANQADGKYTIYFYVKDNADTEFYNQAAENQLSIPYWQFKADTTTKTEEGAKAGLAYSVDGTSPQVLSVKGRGYSDAAATTAATEEDEVVGTSLTLGGTLKQYASFAITANDANGINRIKLTLKQGEKVVETDTTEGSFTPTNDGSTDATWTTKVIDMSAFTTGEVTMTIVPTDNSSLIGNGTYTFYVDFDAPILSNITPSSTVEQTGAVTVKGMASDVGTAGVADIKFAIPSTSASEYTHTQYQSGTTASAWTFDFNGSTTRGNPTFTTFIEELKTAGKFGLLADGGYRVEGTIGTDDIWAVPVYFQVSDTLGNTTTYETASGDWEGYSVRYNPNGDMPVTSITYPTEDDYDVDKTNASLGYATIGGTIRVAGSVAIERSDIAVGAVYLQIGSVTYSDAAKQVISNVDWTATNAHAKNELTSLDVATVDAVKNYLGKDITNVKESPDGVAWWGVKTNNKSASWNLSINAQGGLNPTGTDTNDIAIRACAVNENGKMGNWSEPVYIHVDNAAPKATYTLKKFTSDPGLTATTVSEKDYVADMYLRNPAESTTGKWYIEVALKDESGIDLKSIAVSGSVSTAACDIIANGSSGGGTNYNVYIPVTTVSGASSYSISAQDNDSTGSHTVRMTFTLNIDNDAPVMTDLVQSETEIKYTKLRNKNYGVTFGATATDTGSGFSRLAYFFKRDAANTIELPVPVASGTGWKKGTLLSMTASASKVTGATNGTSVGPVADSDDDSGLYGVYLTGTRGSTTTFAHDAVSYYAGKGLIRVGGIMKIGGTYTRISSISGTTVTFETAIPTTYTEAFFAAAFVVDNTNAETPAMASGINTIGGDDGDGVVETITKSGAVWTWDSTFFSDELDDGPIHIMCAAFDEADNVAAQDTYVMIANNTPRLTKVYLATDLNGDSKYADTEFVEGAVYLKRDDNTLAKTAATSYLSAITTAKESDSSIVTVGAVGDWANASDTTTMLTKLFRISDNSVITMEFVGGVAAGYEGYGEGNNGLTAYLTASGAALTAPETNASHKLGDLVAKDGIPAITYAAAKAQRGITLPATNFYNGGKVTTYGDYTESTSTNGTDNDVKQYLSLTLWDKTAGTTVGTPDSGIGTKDVVFGSQYTVVNIPVYYDFEDDKNPEVTVPKIAPYEDADGNVLGHVEQSDSLSSTYFTTSGNGKKTQWDQDAKISGTVVLSGTITDNKRINTVNVKMAGGTNGEGIWRGDTNPEIAKFSGGTLATKAALNTAYKVNNDAKWSFTITDESFTQEDGHKITWEINLDTTAVYLANSNDHYWTANDLKIEVTAADAARSTTNDDLYVDVVPYITSMERTTAASTSVTQTYRSTYGEYPVALGDTITVNGFNLGGGKTSTKAKPTVTVGGQPVTATMVTDNTEFTFVAPSNSGELRVTVNGIVSLNDKNNNALATNQEAATDSVEKSSEYDAGVLYDNRYLRVWDVGHYFKYSPMGNQPTLATDNEGNLFSSWTLMGTGTVQLQRGLNNVNGPVLVHYDQPDKESALAVDKKSSTNNTPINNGNISVLAFAANVGSSGTPDSTGYADAQTMGGVWGLNLYNNFKDSSNYNLTSSNKHLVLKGNPYYKYDSNINSSGYQLASASMRREVSQFKNGRTVRYGDNMHYIYYDTYNKALRYTFQKAGKKISVKEPLTTDGNYTTEDKTNADRKDIVGWVLLDGKNDEQDRIHHWTGNDLEYLFSNNGGDVGTFTDYKGALQSDGKGVYINFDCTGAQALALAYTDAAGVYKIDVHKVARLGTNNKYLYWTDGEFPKNPNTNTYYTPTGLAVYKGASNVVTTGAAQVTSAGSYASIDVTKKGKPVIVYFDADNETLRIAYASTATIDMYTWADGGAKFTRQTLAGTVSGGTYVQAKIDGDNYLHILYRDNKGKLCYIKSTNAPDGGAYTFNKADILTVDTAGTYGTLSIIKNRTTYTGETYVPCVSFLNSEGTANGVKYAVLRKIDQGAASATGDETTATNGAVTKTALWDTMIVPAVKGNYVTGGEYIYTEGYTGTWTSNTQANSDSVNTQDCDAIIGYNTGRMDVLFLKTEK